jgi:hypothetical protein
VLFTEILQRTWETWDDFEEEWYAWRKRLDASGIASIGPFFTGGEILPDGSTVLEDYEFERYTVNVASESANPSDVVYTEGKIPRSRLDMKRLYEFDPRVDKRSDIKGTRARRTKFYKEFISDMERAKARDRDEVDAVVDNFKRLKPQLEKKKK